jgi:hypothetical protein
VISFLGHIFRTNFWGNLWDNLWDKRSFVSFQDFTAVANFFIELDHDDVGTFLDKISSQEYDTNFSSFISSEKICREAGEEEEES